MREDNSGVQYYTKHKANEPPSHWYIYNFKQPSFKKYKNSEN